MSTVARLTRPAPKHVDERDNIILKSVMHELALFLEDDSSITIAQAAGTDRTALRLSRQIMAYQVERAEKQGSASLSTVVQLTTGHFLNQDPTITKSIKPLGGTLLPQFAFGCCRVWRPALLHADLI